MNDALVEAGDAGAMRNGHNGSLGGQEGKEPAVEGNILLRIQGRSSLIQEEDIGPTQQRTRQAKQLAGPRITSWVGCPACSLAAG